MFPPPLPFYRSLEISRRLFEKFGLGLQQAMIALRANDEVEAPSEIAYGWRDILMEQLKLSRAEYSLLTDSTLPLQRLYGYPETDTSDGVRAKLANVKTFARRVGVTYEELIELLRTKFINPNSWLLPKLERLHVPFSILKALKDGTISDAEFDALLPADLDPLAYALAYGSEGIKAWVKNDANYARIMGLITIANPVKSDDLCSLDELEFRYSDPDSNSLRAIDYVRLLRFIRLWRKLGWTIEQTDKAITALYPTMTTYPTNLTTGVNEAVDLENLDADFRVLLPRLGITHQLIERLKLNRKQDLPGLLASWAPIDTHGPNSLYRQMFLRPDLLKRDPVFADDGYGRFLQDHSHKVLAHTESLRAAFGLTGQEFSLIVAALGYGANTPLTLDNISAIYRRGWLARKLRLSVAEFLRLTQLPAWIRLSHRIRRGRQPCASSSWLMRSAPPP